MHYSSGTDTYVSIAHVAGVLSKLVSAVNGVNMHYMAWRQLEVRQYFI
jgi:hypothetical protein